MKQLNKIDAYAFFRTTEGKVKYNSICKHCTHKCKQSHKVRLVQCLHYEPYINRVIK